MNGAEGYQDALEQAQSAYAPETGSFYPSITSPQEMVQTDSDNAAVCLSGIAQYARELWQTPRLSRVAEVQTVEQARHGDQAAKHRLIEARLPYIMHMAKVYHAYVEHDDLMDIVGVGNVAVAARIDTALTKENPMSYLCGVAKREIRQYCFYRSRLVTIKDHRISPSELPTVVGLNELSAEIADTTPTVHASEHEAADVNAHRNAVRAALGQLTDLQRSIIELHYGIEGSPTSLANIGRTLGISDALASYHHCQAIKRLGKLVAEPVIR